MKTILCMAATVNGYIATEDNETPWSEAVWGDYYELAQQFKALIVGRATYDLMKEVDEFEKIGNPFTVILTHKAFDVDSNFACAASPQEALRIMEGKGFDQVLIGGGGILNGSFIREGLIDEILLDVEPLLFGRGIHLFDPIDFRAKLQLLDTRQISKDTIQLHYKVIK